MRKAMRNRRIEMESTQAEIAALVGIAACFYAQIERGVRGPSAETLLNLEAVLGLPAAVIMEKDSEGAETVRKAHA